MSENLKIECSFCGKEIVRDIYHRLRTGRVLCRNCFDSEIETPRFLFELRALIKSKNYEELKKNSRTVFLVDSLKGKVDDEEYVLKETSGKEISFSQFCEMIKGKNA
ncbi:MAG TPA: hypothetical protein ENH28_08385 [Euryarchaeota archaeon]|nr:hypothetical protein BMS3Bbin15_00213 [archaeon BMS3Bbin15]HDL16150.1 hypothetical protein [Euryarchaeota archaeon]